MDGKSRCRLWMLSFCERNNCLLSLHGEVGFGRIAVGIIQGNGYPSYRWYDDDYNRIDDNGDVWAPVDAYHKHSCVAVLGHGEAAESQLYHWLRWFDDNNFKVETVDRPERDAISMILHGVTEARMVRQQ